MLTQLKAYYDVFLEREAQDAKWGEQNHSPIEWMSILTEEVGEAAEAANHVRWGMTTESLHEARKAFREELVQVAAVAVAAIEWHGRIVVIT